MARSGGVTTVVLKLEVSDVTLVTLFRGPPLGVHRTYCNHSNLRAIRVTLVPSVTPIDPNNVWVRAYCPYPNANPHKETSHNGSY